MFYNIFYVKYFIIALGNLKMKNIKFELFCILNFTIHLNILFS